MKKIVIVLFCLSSLAFGFQATKDTDFGWHYRCGKELLGGNPCLKNKFSYFLPDYKAYYPSFVYDAALAVAYDRFGFIGLSILNSLILLCCAICLYGLIDGQFWLKIILPLLVLLTPGPSIIIGLRPQVFTLLLFLLTLKVSAAGSKSYKNLFLLPLLFALWVNTHIGFIAGVLLLPGIFLGHPLRKKWVVILPLVLAVSATLLNPFGPKVYLEIFRHFQAPLSTTIAEWVTPPLWLKGIILFAVFELTLFLYAKKQLTPSSLINLLIFTVLACFGIRNLIFLSVLAAVYFSRCLPHKKIFGDFIVLVTVLFFLAFFPKNLKPVLNFSNEWKNYCLQGQIRYPCALIEKYSNLKGNVFAAYEWGGFLIWKMPGVKVFADGRTPSWLDENGNSTYEIYLAIIQAQPGWNEKLTETKTDYIMTGPGTFLDLKLKPNPVQFGWQELYRNPVAVLYQKI